MPTTSKIFIDSSVLIEALKGTKAAFYSDIIKNNNFECCINDIVVSEYLYQFLGINGGAAPLSLKSSKRIPNIIEENISLALILNDFTFLSSSNLIPTVAIEYMHMFNMLPNDAIILATCSIHDIKILASHDSDYIIPCKELGILLLNDN
ncbi:MAG TPA: PIN domain-containing protein [Panacibacter sp.]|nr:PIN domain-containing protein [Panacibacter sp.]